MPGFNIERHKRHLILSSDIIERLSQWHGGQWTATYSLLSTGLNNLVSPAMVEAAIDELASVEKRIKDKKTLGELYILIGDLQMMVDYPEEFDARAAGMDVKEYKYDSLDDDE